MHVISPQQRVIEFLTSSNKFFLPGKTYVGYEKNQIFYGYRSKYVIDDDLKYICLDTISHHQIFAVDIDGNVSVDLIEQLIEDGKIPRPIYIASTISMDANGYVYHRPHIVWAISPNSTVRRAETTKEIKNGRGKGKSKYVTSPINHRALQYYNGCRDTLCTLLELEGLNVDFHRPNVVKSPFSKHWHIAYYGDETYSLADIIAYTNDDVKKRQRERLIEKKQAKQQDLFRKLNIDSISIEEAAMKSMHDAVARSSIRA